MSLFDQSTQPGSETAPLLSSAQRIDDGGPSTSDDSDTRGTFRSTINKIEDFFYHPFSASALSKLPDSNQSLRASQKSKRKDRIPELESRNERPLLRDYMSIPNAEGVQVRVPSE